MKYMLLIYGSFIIVPFAAAGLASLADDVFALIKWCRSRHSAVEEKR